MKKITQSKPRKTKKRYYILFDGLKVGETWAVSPDKARVNFWWKYVKGECETAPRGYDPEDFDVIEAEVKAWS